MDLQLNEFRNRLLDPTPPPNRSPVPWKAFGPSKPLHAWSCSIEAPIAPTPWLARWRMGSRSRTSSGPIGENERCRRRGLLNLSGHGAVK